jgi:hypothetical protein
MPCPRCGRLNPRDVWQCEYCGADLNPRPPAPGEGRGAAGGHAGSALALTVALALLLTLVGIGAVRASSLLQQAVRTASAGDLAAAVCAELKAQDYSKLVSQLSSTADPTSAQGELDPATAVATLQALDTSSGRVTTCQVRELSFVSRSSHGAVANFALTIQRAHQTGAQGLVLILMQQSDGTWAIVRSSNLASGS